MTNFETEIASKEKAITAKLDEAEQICNLFVAETVTLLTEGYRSVAKSIGKSQPFVSQKLGQDGIRKLMVQIDELIQKTDEICRLNLKKKSAWRHLSWNDKNRYEFYHKRGSHYVSGELGDFQGLAHHFFDCVGPFGDLLKRAGFETGQKDHCYGAYADSESVPHPKVVEQFKWSESMKAHATDYRRIERELSELEREINELRAQKAREDSDNLWNTM